MAKHLLLDITDDAFAYHRDEGKIAAEAALDGVYVEWHMRQAWARLLFADEDQDAKLTRDPVAPATRSKACRDKVARRRLDDGSPAHSFATLLAELASITKNTCRAAAGQAAPTFQVLTTPNPKQIQGLELIDAIRP